MIPILYGPSETAFETNGLGRLADATSAIVREQRNGIFTLEMEMPIFGQHFSDIGLGSIVMAKPSPARSPQPFEIYSIEKSTDGMSAEIFAQHLSYRLNRIPVLPFTAGSVSQALQGLISHAAEINPFTFWTDVTRAGFYSQKEPSSARARLQGEKGSIVQTFGGELMFDRFTVNLLANRGINSGKVIRYGKDIVSLQQDQNIQNTITGILPYWRGSEGEEEVCVWLPEVVLYSSHASDFPNARTVCVDFSGDFDQKPTEAELRAAGNQYIADNDIGVPVVGFDVDFVALAQTTEYASIANLERVELCDIVSVLFSDFGVNASAKVTETYYDVLKERYTKIRIGDQRFTVANTIAQQSKDLKDSEAKTETFLSQALAQATAQINGELDGAIMKTQTDADGNPIGLIFMDTNDPATAVNCLRINYAGIGFSNSGIDGPYSSTWDITNTLNMGNINVINLSASVITTGILRDATGTNYWNLDTGELRMTGIDVGVGARNYVRNSNTLDFKEYSFAWHMTYNGHQALVNGHKLEVRQYGN